jgi:hypothetical protein
MPVYLSSSDHSASWEVTSSRWGNWEALETTPVQLQTELNRKFEVIGALARAELSEVSDATIEML